MAKWRTEGMAKKHGKKPKRKRCPDCGKIMRVTDEVLDQLGGGGRTRERSPDPVCVNPKCPGKVRDVADEDRQTLTNVNSTTEGT